MKAAKKIMLIILDGWGYSTKAKWNAPKTAATPNLDYYLQNFPHAILKCGGKFVGLPKGQMGNSEVGHATIGAGRVIDVDLTRINKAIQNGSFFRNKTLLQAIKNVKKQGSALHLLGLVSDGGVHSHINHLFALLKLAKMNGIKDRIYIHCILDGRDTLPNSAKKYITKLFLRIRKLGIKASIATIMGRYYGMDRDNRWHREHKAYDAMVNKMGRIKAYKEFKKTSNSSNQLKFIHAILENYYRQDLSDEFIPPTVIGPGRVEQNDSVIFFNFRSDRARELTRAFVDGSFKGFRRKRILKLCFVCLTQYDSKIRAPAAFPPSIIKHSLGEIIARMRLPQLRVAETEKYAHVTFFFNCGREKPFPGEHRILIPSPKVKTYDKKPEMSAFRISAAIIKALKTTFYPFVVVNFANGDMVGHTGIFKAAVNGCSAVDSCIGKIVSSAKDCHIIITADHGNCEDMPPGKTSHSLNPVQFIILSGQYKLRNGSLADIAPTILKMMGIQKPPEMTGKSLLK